jgi:hypothetical protein
MLDDLKMALRRLRESFSTKAEKAYADRDAAAWRADLEGEAYARGEGDAYGIAEGEVRRAEATGDD